MKQIKHIQQQPPEQRLNSSDLQQNQERYISQTCASKGPKRELLNNNRQSIPEQMPCRCSPSNRGYLTDR